MKWRTVVEKDNIQGGNAKKTVVKKDYIEVVTAEKTVSEKYQIQGGNLKRIVVGKDKIEEGAPVVVKDNIEERKSMKDFVCQVSYSLVYLV